MEWVSRELKLGTIWTEALMAYQMDKEANVSATVTAMYSGPTGSTLTSR